jgi:ribonuclease D
MNVTLVDDVTNVAAALARLPDGPWGIDVERADSLRYHRTAALIQVGASGEAVLLDPLAIEDFSVLNAAVADRLAILHALSNDLVPLARAGIEATRMADTSIAAALLGLPTGLAPLMESLLDVQLASDKERFQRANWEQRPLPDDMLDYAAGDVADLPALWAVLEERLHALGRWGWYEEELVEAIRGAREDERSWEDVKGAGRLDPQERAILRAIWLEREDIASSQDVAPNRILHDSILVDLARHPPETERGLVTRSDRRRSVLRRNAGRLFAAVETGATDAPIGREGPRRRWDDADREAHDRMRRARSELADEIGIDAGVLCPGRLLWQGIAADPENGVELCRAAGLRTWQVELLHEVLWEAYTAEDD